MLEKYSKTIVLLILIIVLAVSLKLSSEEATTMDEQAHIPAAYTYVKYGDMRLNPEHPPLLKDMAGIPLLFLDVNFPTDDPMWTEGVNEQWILGNGFIHANDADAITFWSRVPILLIALILGIFIFQWTKELAGAAAGLFALILYATDPNILGHNHYVTTDLGIAAMIFISFYFFVKFIRKPSWKNTVLAGVFLGIVQLTKFSAVLLFPYFALIILVYAIARKKPDFVRTSPAKFKWMKLLEYTGKYALMVVICFILIWILYYFNTMNMSGEKLVDISNYVFGDEGSGKIAKDIVISMSSVPILKPLGEFFLGVFMVFVRVSGGNTFYYFGEVYKNAVPSYFPAVFMLKETIPFLILFFFTSFFAVFQMLKNILSQHGNIFKRAWKVFANYMQTGVSQYSMLGFIFLYSYLSITGNLNIGFRHLFPIMALMYVLMAKKVFDFIKSRSETSQKMLRIIVFVFAIWMIAIPVISYPSYMSYFNELVGGPQNGYKYVTDSNLDWGQDLKRLHSWVNENNIDKIRVDYFGGSNPGYYLGDKFIPWTGTNEKQPGWYAISALFLQESIFKDKPEGENDYSWTLELEPIRIGDSIFVYYVE